MNDGYRNDPAINQGGVFAVPSAILPIGAVAEMKVLSNFQPNMAQCWRRGQHRDQERYQPAAWRIV